MNAVIYTDSQVGRSPGHAATKSHRSSKKVSTVPKSPLCASPTRRASTVPGVACYQDHRGGPFRGGVYDLPRDHDAFWRVSVETVIDQRSHGSHGWESLLWTEKELCI